MSPLAHKKRCRRQLLVATRSSCPAVGAELKVGRQRRRFRRPLRARDHELGPIALAMVKRNVARDALLDADDLAAVREILVDPRRWARTNVRGAVSYGCTPLQNREVPVRCLHRCRWLPRL